MKRLVAKLGPNGELKVEAKGFKGKACQKEVEDLIRRMGVKTTAATHKPEWYASEIGNGHALQTGG